MSRQYPLNYWHCRVRAPSTRVKKSSWDAIAVDLSFDTVENIVKNWKSNSQFFIEGYRVNPNSDDIQIVHTPHSQKRYQDEHNQHIEAENLVSLMPTYNFHFNPKSLPFSTNERTDYTNQLLQSEEVSMKDVTIPLLQTVTRPQLRRLLNNMQISDADLDAFCIDYFPEIYKEFSSSMNRQSKLNTLLSKANLEEIFRRLSENHPALIHFKE